MDYGLRETQMMTGERSCGYTRMAVDRTVFLPETFFLQEWPERNRRSILWGYVILIVLPSIEKAVSCSGAKSARMLPGTAAAVHEGMMNSTRRGRPEISVGHW